MNETVVRCGVEVCPTCGTVRENEAGEIRELRLKLLQAEEALGDALQTSSDAQKMELQKLRADISRLRIERDKALQSAAYAKAQYDALQEHFTLVNS